MDDLAESVSVEISPTKVTEVHREFPAIIGLLVKEILAEEGREILARHEFKRAEANLEDAQAKFTDAETALKKSQEALIEYRLHVIELRKDIAGTWH